MTPQEFKAWFEGFTDACGGVPTKAQWDRIKARVAEIDGSPITEKIFIDRFLPSYPVYPTYPAYPNYYTNPYPTVWTNNVIANCTADAGYSTATLCFENSDGSITITETVSALRSAGRAEGLAFRGVA